jgi:peptide/nickel transport system substrate-binding protein
MGFWAMHAAPGGDGAFVLEQYLRSDATTGFSGLVDPAIDAALDRLREIDAPDARAAAIRGIEKQVFARAPLVYLMTPVWHVGLSARVVDYVPYPSDYYVVRADLRVRD